MIRIIRTSIILGIALGTSSLFVFAQSALSAEAAPAAGQKSTAVMPEDQKPTMEQLTKLFEVMRLKEQMQSMRQMVPAMVQQQIASAMKQTEGELPSGTKLTPEQRDAMQTV